MGRIFLLLILLSLMVGSFHAPLEEAWNAFGLQQQTATGGPETLPGRGLLLDWLTNGRIRYAENSIQAMQEKIAQSLQRMDGLEQKTSQTLSSCQEQVKQLQNQVSAIAIDWSKRVETVEHQGAALSQRVDTLAKAGWHIEQGSLLVEKQDENWKLSDVFFKKRTYKKTFIFPTPFLLSPTVHLGLTALDLTNDEGRMQVFAEDVQPASFTLVVETQSSERVRSVGILWTAFGHAAP